MIRHVLKNAEAVLLEHELPLSYAKFVMNELLNDQDRNLYLEMDAELSAKESQRFQTMIQQLCTGLPLAYVLGYQVFYGYRISVNKDVLIPRFETEELVMRVLQTMDDFFDTDALVCCDIATGSGAIACALKKESPALSVFASDISETAIRQAQQNAQDLEAEIEFFVGDMLDPMIKRSIKADIMVCNPPYIPTDEVPEDSVLNFEPHLALFGGKDGLKFYQQFFRDVSKVIKPKAILAFEMGYQQKAALTDLALSYFPHACVDVYQDMQGKDRILILSLKPE